MPDRFTEVTTVGYGSRIVNSIGGIVIGFILFIASFFVLFYNEGSVDYSNIAKTAVQIDSAVASTDSTLNGKLVSTSGALVSDETLGDDLYLKPDKYIALQRSTEMYSWVEKESSHSTTNVGGSETRSTTYDYVKEWTSNPDDSSNFKYPDGHENPALSLEGAEKRVSKATVGVYDVDMAGATLPTLTVITLTADNTTLKEGAQLAGSQYIYLSKSAGSTYQVPAIGDIRVSYSALKSGTNVTVFGKLNNKTISTYLDPDNHTFFQIFTGTREEAISTLHESFVMWKWIFRGVGFLMMWIGLTMILAPLSVVMDVLPMLGTLSRSLVGVVTFVVALVLSGVTILVSMLFHNVVALVIAIVVVSGLVFFILNSRKKTAGPSGPPSPTVPPSPTGPPA